MKKPFYKKWWFWGIVIFFILGIAGTHDKKNSEHKVTSSESQQATKQVENKQEKNDKSNNEVQNKKQIKDKDEVKVKKVTVDEYKGRINQAFKEMGRKTNLKINSTEVLEDGRTAIALSENIVIFLTTDKDKYINKAVLGMTANAYSTENKDFDFAFLLLIGTIDDSLNYSERYLVKRELGLSDKKVFSEDNTKSYKKNGVSYTYKGSMKDNFILQAEL
ncbi:hypothetical protein BK704_02220 [[Bacillus thuringiensis] serovar konkukian]|nr:hypothetical protein [Bacillus thuringiensis]MED1299806.1 hypothetical protein [Bacillus pacificus]OUB16744.1 hypothetical protein BK704_02220 [[Bacillus thuringiensis] serovar konkukian]